MEDGIEPEISLSSRFNIVSLLNSPISDRISPDSMFPVKSSTARLGKVVRHAEILPEMAFQSAMEHPSWMDEITTVNVGRAIYAPINGPAHPERIAFLDKSAD
ncbi:Uncharacterized protein Fot_25578 [Forsythia ovata]|uniref:Uncharacterized protein n=1 Tax=Forsythia ovata TaxID=205694 RepID=A0ABD1U9F6_9LAMI